MDDSLRQTLESFFEESLTPIRRNFEQMLANVMGQLGPSGEPVQRQLRERFKKVEEIIRLESESFLTRVITHKECTDVQVAKIRELFRTQMSSFSDEVRAIVVSGFIADTKAELFDPDNSPKH